MALRTLIPLAAALFAFQDAAPSVTVRRKIVEEPVYVAEPRYGLFVLDEKQDLQAWVVCDKSDATLPYYDVVYFDLDNDGRLNEPGERFTGNFNASSHWLRIQIGYHVGQKERGSWYKRFEIWTVIEKDNPGFAFKARWNDKVQLYGGYGDEGRTGVMFGTTPASAPVFHLEPLGPLSFSFDRAQNKADKLEIDEIAHLAFVVGRPGEGANTLTAVDMHFLERGKDLLHAELIGKDVQGNEIRKAFPIRNRC